jgi:hypothetical protein
LSIPISAKVEISRKGFTLGVKTFQSAPSTNKCQTLWPCIGPKVEKRIPSNLGGQFATLGANVPAFIDILTTMF